MTTLGFDKPLYILPIDHRGSFQKKMFGLDGEFSPQQTAEVAAARRVIFDAWPFRPAWSSWRSSRPPKVVVPA